MKLNDSTHLQRKKLKTIAKEEMLTNQSLTEGRFVMDVQRFTLPLLSEFTKKKREKCDEYSLDGGVLSCYLYLVVIEASLSSFFFGTCKNE